MAKARKVWVCQTWKEHPERFKTKHIFDDPGDGYCPVEPRYHGILQEEVPPPIDELYVSIAIPENGQEFEEGSITISAEAFVSAGNTINKVEFFVDDKKIGEDLAGPYSYPFSASRGEHTIYAKVWDNRGETARSKDVLIKVRSNPVPEVGLCVMLMDASSSMTDPVFPRSPLTKMRLVAGTAASGIFDLERMMNNPYAFVAAFKFDDRVELMFVDTVANLINRFDRNVKKFEDYIYDELMKFQQGTDINQALREAHLFVDKFLKKQLPNFLLKKYRSMTQRVLKHDSSESVAIPNVRVLIYTDGMQYTDRDKVLRPNPFKQSPLEGLNHDILIGAFFGKETDDGCKDLRGILSRCPIHDELQFFLFDNPAKIGDLKYLFRMASGASGFCPKCLEKELYNW
jgi:hypothetical protein